jgi:hypothetical protein
MIVTLDRCSSTALIVNLQQPREFSNSARDGRKEKQHRQGRYQNKRPKLSCSLTAATPKPQIRARLAAAQNLERPNQLMDRLFKK